MKIFVSQGGPGGGCIACGSSGAHAHGSICMPVTCGPKPKTALWQTLIRGERGTSMLEFAIVGPVFLLLVMGLVQFAIWLFGISLTHYAADQACRTGAAWVGALTQSVQSPTTLAPAFVLVSNNRAEETARDVLGVVSFASAAGITPDYRLIGITKAEQQGDRDFEIEARLVLPLFVPVFPSVTYERTARCRLERFSSY